MFSGIVEEVGTVERIVAAGSASLTIGCRTVLDGTRVGDSIAVNGVCLTVAARGERSFTADLQPVTRRRSNLGELRPGAAVNLERSLVVGQRIGGHYVQGHVDGVGRIVGREGDGPSLVVRIAVPPELLRYVVLRGFVAVDGASLTVARRRSDGFDVSLVEHTQRSITLPNKTPGSAVNVEVDVIGKYVERLVGQVGSVEASTTVGTETTLDLLRRSGFV